jgi:catechol 2,3-dioxygenase-like lactoylglutathione lyase family enzyme
MLVGFHHPGIVVSDLEQAQQFYGEALGFEPIRRDDWDESFSDLVEKVIGVKNTAAKCLLLKGQNCFLELFEYLSPPSQGDPKKECANDFGIAHLAFQVIDIFAACERLKAAGAITHGEPVQVGAGYSIYCRDPFGNIIELAQIGADEPDFDLIKGQLLPASPNL